MLTLNDFAEIFKDVCPESIIFSAVPEPDVDFVTDLAKQQTDEISEKFCKFFANLFFDMSKEKIILSGPK